MPRRKVKSFDQHGLVGRNAGFTSAYDREQVAPGVAKRVFEGVYCKVLVPEDELVRPDRNNLTPRARALFDALFPDESTRALELAERGS